MLCVVAIGIVLAVLGAIHVSAPTFHDEAIVLLELSGQLHATWPTLPMDGQSLKQRLLEGDPTLSSLTSTLRKTDIHPPLYYITALLWRKMFGPSLWCLRLLSVAIWVGVLTVFWKLTGGSLAWIFLALSPLGVGFATISRDYALACLWIVLTVYLVDEPHLKQTRSALLGGITGAAAVWTHYLALLPIGVIMVWTVARYCKLHKRQVILASTILLALAAPALGLGLLQLRPATAAPFRGFRYETYAMVRELLRTPITPGLTHGRIIDWIGSCLFLFALLRAGQRYRASAPRVKLSLFLVCSFPLGLLLLSCLVHNSLATARYVGLCLPFCALLLANAFSGSNIVARASTAVVIAFLLVVCFAEGVNVLSLGKTQRRIFTDRSSQALAIVSSTAGPGVPAAILSDIPNRTDIAVMGGVGDFIPISTHFDEYQSILFCPSGQSKQVDTEMIRRGQMRRGDVQRVFREYDCYVSTLAESTNSYRSQITTQPAPAF